MGKNHRRPAETTSRTPAPAPEPEGFFDSIGAMGNSFVQDAMGLGQEAVGMGQELLGGDSDSDSGAMGYMHSPFLLRLLGHEEEPRHPERDFSTDPSAAWSRESLESRLNYDYEGADGKSLVGDDGLRNVMTTLAEERPDTDDPEQLAAWESQQKKAALQLGEMRGQSPEEAMKGYSDYRRLQREQREAAEREGLEVPEALDMDEHGDHMGSIQQLRYGSYVGQTMGIDDVYGALLNPTGGLVGEGNEGYSADPNSVASYHGEAHDAFGYLANYHDEGPGYMYANPEEAHRYGNSDPGDLRPYTGQASGFQLWNDMMADNGMADPVHPGDPNSQMRDSLRELGQGDLVDGPLSRPIRTGWNPTPGMPDVNPSVPGPAENIPGLVETVEEVIHSIGNFDYRDILA